MLRTWDRLALPARVGAVVCAGLALFGLLTTLSSAARQLSTAGRPELAARVQTWGPIYGFAAACAPHLTTGASVLLVDPTGQATGTEGLLPGAAPDADWSNASHFSYALYPRRVSLLGRVPAGWDPAAAGTGYVAIWQQAAFRPPAAVAEAAAAGAAAVASPRLTQVCDYADAAGDRGAVYALAVPPSASAVPAGALGSPLTWSDYPAALLGLASMWLIGLALISLIAAGRLPAGLAVGLALPLGAFAVATQLLLYSEAGIPWSWPLLAPPWLLLGVIAAARDRGRVAAPLRPGRLAARWRGLPPDHRLALAGLTGLVVVTAVVAPLSLPFSDGIDFYYAKAQAFFLDGGVVPYLLRGRELPFSAPAHPPLVPLSVTWLYLFTGHVNEHASLLFWPACYASALAAFHALVRSRLGGRLAAWLTLAFAAIGFDLASAALLGSYADLPLALDLLAAAGLVALWLSSPTPSPRPLVLAGLFLAAAALTKEEGLILGTGMGLALAAVLVLTGRDGRVAVALAAVVAGVASLPLLWLRLRYPQPELTVSGHVALAGLPRAVLLTLLGLGARAAVRWAAPAALAAAVLLGARRPLLRRPDASLGFLLLFWTVALAVYSAAMVLDPRNLDAELQHTAGRLLDQVLPLPFLTAAWLLPALGARGSPERPPVAMAESVRVG